MARVPKGLSAPVGRVLSYPLVPAVAGEDAPTTSQRLVARVHKMTSHQAGRAVVHETRETANGYVLGTVEIDAPPIGGTPIPKPKRRRRK